MTQEQTVLFGSASQILNFWAYLLLGSFMLAGVYFLFSVWTIPALAWMGVVALAMLWKYLSVSSQRYELTTQRLKTQTGIFSKMTHELELYRVKDIMLEQPFFLRLFGLGNVVLMTSDVSTPELTLRAIPDAANCREKIRKCVEERRDQKRTRIAEME